MIVPMKKVTVLVLDTDQQAALEVLQGMGAVHVEAVTPPEGRELDDLRGQIEETERAADWLGGVETPTAGTDAAPEEIVKTATELRARVQGLEEQLRTTQAERDRVAPLGSFDVASVAALSAKGLTLRIFQLAADEAPDWPTTALVQEIGKADDLRYVAVIAQEDFESTASEVRLPERSLKDLQAAVDALQRSVDACETERGALAGGLAAVQTHLAEIQDRADFARARLGMGADGRVAYLAGYCPAERMQDLEQASKEHGWAVIAAEPAAEDTVPTEMRFPSWIRPIKGVYDVIKIIPGYREQDISGVFLPFFSIFFAMLIGDAGYGLIFLALTAFARTRMKTAPAYPFALLALLSVGTVIWGTLTGNFFGIAAEHAPLRSLQVNWLRDDTNVMRLCFLIGAIHMTIAHVWRFLVLLPNRKALSQLGWISVLWAMFFCARMLVTGAAAPSFTLAMLITGAVLILLFTATTKQELKREGINLVMLPLDLVSALVDVISYIRLFAVGMASLAVAESFNGMAMDIGFSNALIGLGSAMILFFGHLLNIVLCGLAVLVHGIRLNTLEFSMHMGMEWSGVPYKPLARRNQAD